MRIIREILISKYLFFYKFEEIIGTSLNVAPPYISESGHPDCITAEDEVGDIGPQDYARFLKENILEENIHGSRKSSRDQVFLLSLDFNDLKV